MELTLEIPRSAAHLMATKSLADVYAGLHVGAIMPVLEVLTFGMINTPITLNATGELCAYVVEWENRVVTVHRVGGCDCTVIGMEFVAHAGLDCDEALALFRKYWGEQR